MSLPGYFAPASLDEALRILAEKGDQVKVVAGGTDVLVGLRSGSLHPGWLLDLRLIPLDHIDAGEAYLTLGARVTHTRLLNSPVVADRFPALQRACGSIGGPPVRNRGTLGGNLVNASPSADTAPPLLVYDAAVVLMRAGTKRTVRLVEFFKGPGQSVVEPDEILTEIHVPYPPPTTAASFLRLGKRRAMAMAIASVAVRLSLSANGRVDQARIALGSVAPRPFRAFPAEERLAGERLTESAIDEAAREAAGLAKPITDLYASASYRRRMVVVLTRRALTAAWHALREGSGDD